MPYITQERRAALNDGEIPTGPGELNYVLTTACLQYCQDALSGPQSVLSYAVVNDVMGALAGAQAEFYRRVAAPYEDAKAAENGDVYEGWSGDR